MQSGRRTLGEIETALATLRRNESQFDSALQSAEAEVARLRQARGEALRAFARIKLDSLQQGQIAGALDTSERQAMRLIEEHKHEIAGLAERMKALSAQVEAAEADRHVKAEAVEKALQALDALRAKVEAGLASNAQWATASAQANSAKTTIAAADAKAKDAEEDLGTKRKPYDDDALFGYLWQRKFGTSDYASTGFTRFMDRWLARHIDYENARVAYGKLIEIPNLLKQHAEAVKLRLAAATDLAAKIEREALMAAGGAPLEKALENARAHLAKAEAALAERTASLKQTEEKRDTALSAEGSDSYREAIRVLTEADAQDSIRQLYAEAGRTSTPSDDRVVEKIEDIDQRLKAAETEVIDIRKQAREIAMRRSEFETLRDRFRQQGFDHPNVVFRNEGAIGNTIGSIMTGAVQTAILWEMLRQSQSLQYPQSQPDFGGGWSFPVPHQGGGGWSPGDSGGSWSGGGGSSGGGGGDFSTGGGF
jgi:DNA repair exonuclease SbcCD ATPase subunit